MPLTVIDYLVEKLKLNLPEAIVKVRFYIGKKYFRKKWIIFVAPSEMRSREKEARYGRGGGNFGRRDRSRR